MFLDTSNMSVDELIQKQIEIRRKISQAIGSGMGSGVVSQLNNMLEQLSIEISSKAALEQEAKKREQAIEQGKDPDDNVLNIGDVE
jgi:rRNA-processing protein FCF1